MLHMRTFGYTNHVLNTLWARSQILVIWHKFHVSSSRYPKAFHIESKTWSLAARQIHMLNQCLHLS